MLRHSHTTPFEMCEIKLHVKVPIFIARQWIRHRTANVNEYSARYSVLDREYYMPDAEHLAKQSKNNKQGRGDSLDNKEAERVLQLLKNDAEQCYDHYIDMLNVDENNNIIDENKSCLARELARMNLTLNYYTQWYWKIDLHNLLHFLRLRTHAHAQFEIREYGNVILDIVSKWVPHTYDAFVNHKMNSVTLSQKAMDVLKRMLKGENVEHKDSGMSKREWEEFISSIK